MSGDKHLVVCGPVKMQHHLSHPTAASLSRLYLLACHLGLFKYSMLLAAAVTPVMLQQRVIDFAARLLRPLCCKALLRPDLVCIFFSTQSPICHMLHAHIHAQ